MLQLLWSLLALTSNQTTIYNYDPGWYTIGITSKPNICKHRIRNTRLIKHMCRYSISIERKSNKCKYIICVGSLPLKANVATTYTMAQVDTWLSLNANQTDVSAALSLNANQATTFTMTQIDGSLALKANQSTKYFMTQVDTPSALNAHQGTTYTMAQVHTSFAWHQIKHNHILWLNVRIYYYKNTKTSKYIYYDSSCYSLGSQSEFLKL